MMTISNINERVPRDVKFVTISEGFRITEIPNSYCKECHSLKYIQMPDDTFSECWNLVEICLLNNLTHISQSCFDQCLSLRKFKWNMSMIVLEPYITLKSYAFLNCRNLQKVNLSESSIYYIEEGSFSNRYNLEYVMI